MSLLLLGAGTTGTGTAYSPATALTGLIGWWDASNFASLTLSGSNLTVWGDISGASHNLSAGLPTYSATGFNSKPGIVYSTSALQAATNSSFPLGTGNTLTCFMAFTMLSANLGGGYPRVLSYTGGAAAHDYDNDGSFVIQRDNLTSNLLPERHATQVSVAYGYSTPRRLIFTIKSDGTTTVYIDGVSTSVGTLNAAFASPGYLAVGYSKNDSSTNNFGGSFGEVGVATGYHDATAVAALDTYLKNKWGL